MTDANLTPSPEPDGRDEGAAAVGPPAVNVPLLSLPHGVPEPYADTAEKEHQFHDYTGNAIPWYVRLVWIGFWCFAVYYVVRYLFPALQVELITPP